MNWFTWIVGTGLLVLASVKGKVLPTNKNCATAPVPLSIDKVARRDVNKFDVCCTGCTTLGTDEKYLLGITVNDGDQQIYDSATVNDPCVEYGFDIISLASAEDKLTIAMQTLDVNNCPTAGGLVTIASFPALPVTFRYAIGSNPDKTETDITDIIRVEGDMGTFTFPDIDIGYKVSSSSEDFKYYFIKSTPTILTPCYETTDIQVCDAPVADSADYDAGIPLKSAILQYQDGPIPKATIIADTSSLEKQEKETRVTTTYDMIIFSEDKKQKNLCSNIVSGVMECDIIWTTGDKMADVRLVQIDDNIPTAYQKNPIQDRELLASPIGSTSIEARWLFMADSEKVYNMIKSTATADTAVTVDCSGVTTSPNCFGYFTGLSADTYRVTIQSKKGIMYDTNSQIRTKPIIVSRRKALSNELNIHLTQLEWQHERKASATICFNHKTTNSERSFSHYEFVIINNKGQWLKHKNMTQDLMGDICFAPLLISTETFDVSEGATLIVTQRDEDGFTVLAEGETHIDFKRT